MCRSNYNSNHYFLRNRNSNNSLTRRMTDVAQFKHNDIRAAAFVQKLYTMIDQCDPKLAGWTKEGNMFVIKDPAVFATSVIPKYFIHNKFTSFARQLNFYGFRKVPTKPIRNDDFDKSTAEHVIFHHPLFMKDRQDLLPDIKRHSTNHKATTKTTGGKSGVSSVGENSPEDEQEIKQLKRKVKILKDQLKEMENDYSVRVENLNRDYLKEVKNLLELLPPGLLDNQTILDMSKETLVSVVSPSDVIAPSHSRVVTDDEVRGSAFSKRSRGPPKTQWKNAAARVVGI